LNASARDIAVHFGSGPPFRSAALRDRIGCYS